MYGAKVVDVRVSREIDLTWLVWMNEAIVGRFLILGEALDYATLLECTPRARAEAVASPRAHVAERPRGLLLCYEPGLPGEQIRGYVPRPYDELHMFFGAVQAASVADDGTVDAAHDPRRSGRSLLV